MISDEAAAVMAIIGMQEKLNDMFLRTLVTQLSVSVPEFDAQAFLDTLYLDQANLPTPAGTENPNERELRKRALDSWLRKVQLTEAAIQDAQQIVSRLREGKPQRE